MTTRLPSEVKTEAEALAICLGIGAIEVADVVAWADALIARGEPLHWSVCEVALMARRSGVDVANALRDVPGQLVSESIVIKEVIRRLALALAADRSRADRIASTLHCLAPDLSGRLGQVAYWACDELYLIDAGIIPGTREQVIDVMLEALEKASSGEDDRCDGLPAPVSGTCRLILPEAWAEWSRACTSSRPKIDVPGT